VAVGKLAACREMFHAFKGFFRIWVLWSKKSSGQKNPLVKKILWSKKSSGQNNPLVKKSSLKKGFWGW
jgi:hypothetical protein